MIKYNILVAILSFIISNSLFAAQHQVKMWTSNKGEMMVFEPAVLKIMPGDTVKWLNSNPGHNSASIDGMIPSGSTGWNGKMNEEIEVTFDKEGVYGYKCTPHYVLGMVGFIIVGDNKDNLGAVEELAKKAEEKFATNKTRFSDYLSQIK